jgi:hypothetical protein
MIQIFHAGMDALAPSTRAFSRSYIQWLRGIVDRANAADVDIAALEAFDAADRFSITCVLDGGGAAIVAGGIAYVRIPRTGTVTGWEVVADVSGSLVVDVWKDTYANFPPTIADTIAGSEKPTLSAAQKAQDLTLSTWTTTLVVGEYLAFKVDSAATITWAAVTLIIDPT